VREGRLAGHIAVVTGAAGGIGRACCELFAAEGARVAAVDCRDAEGTAGWTPVRCDLSSEAEVREAAASIVNGLGEPSIVVHAAGVAVFRDTLSTTGSDFTRTMNANVLSFYHLAQAFAPAMRKRRAGSFVAVASINGILGAPGLSAYSASKGALITLVRTLALELAESNIRVNCVCPASIDTPLLQESFDRQPDPAKAREANIRRHPLGRLGTPLDVARLALFLASDEASWITGATYLIDGGASLARRWQE
jgi:2-keto-3-deoxy-L-fuconate dehydrogenase